MAQGSPAEGIVASDEAIARSCIRYGAKRTNLQLTKQAQADPARGPVARSRRQAQMLPRRAERSPPAFVPRLSRTGATGALRVRGSAAAWPSAQPVRGARRSGSLEHPCLLNRINYGPSIKSPKGCADRQSHCGPVHTVGAHHRRTTRPRCQGRKRAAVPQPCPSVMPDD